LIEFRGVFLGYAPGEGLEGPGRDLAQRLGANNLDTLAKMALTMAQMPQTGDIQHNAHDSLGSTSEGKDGARRTGADRTDDGLPPAAHDPGVISEMQRAWRDSNPTAPSVPKEQSGSMKHEQGGWVVVTKDGFRVIRVPAGTRDHLFWGPKPPGAVMHFHTHPNTWREGYSPFEPGPGDIPFRQHTGIPGVIVTFGRYVPF
jgi:hypothetical protein